MKGDQKPNGQNVTIHIEGPEPDDERRRRVLRAIEEWGGDHPPSAVAVQAPAVLVPCSCCGFRLERGELDDEGRCPGCQG